MFPPRMLCVTLALGAILVAGCEQPTVPGGDDQGARAGAATGCAEEDSCDGGGSDGGGATDGGAALFAPCSTNADCASMLCHFYPGTGMSFCTKPCASAADCPTPSPGCNGMGVCRLR